MRNPILQMVFTGMLLLLIIDRVYSFYEQPENEVITSEKQFYAGAAKTIITPFLGEEIVGDWGMQRATYIHDELYARCLVLDDGLNKLVFIVMDVVGIGQDLADEAKRKIYQTSGIPARNVMISAVHTHSACSVQGNDDDRNDWRKQSQFDDYQKFVIRRISDVVQNALQNLEPAQIGWGRGSVPEHVFIRRWKLKPGSLVYNPFGGKEQVKMNPGRRPDLLEPAGRPDPDVTFISVRSIDGRPISLLANYSLHYVGGVPRGHISADYFGVFADRIQAHLMADRMVPPFVGMMTNGTSGDINNINYGAPAVKKEPYEQINLVAEDVAREVFRVQNTIVYHNWVPIDAYQRMISLKVRKPDQSMIMRAEEVLDQNADVKTVYPHEKTYANRLIKHLNWPDQIDIPLQTFCIGDLGVAAIPFEVFAETGLELKEKSPFDQTFIVELANGSYGYLPSPEQHAIGGYETWLPTCRVEVQASRIIVGNILDMFTIHTK